MTTLVVDRQGAHLRKDGARLLVRCADETVESTPIESLEQVVLVGRGVNATTPLHYDLIRRGIDVVYLSQNGHFAFRLSGPLAKHSALRTRQVFVAADPEHALALARAVVEGKLQNQETVLGVQGERFGADLEQAQQVIRQQIQATHDAKDVDTLRGYEGYAARAYFGAWRQLIPSEWAFDGRNYHPPRDPVNALLSLGYTLLLQDIVGAVYRVGLDPTIGFFHAIDYGRPSLALDVEEEFRPIIIDTMVLDLLRQKAFVPGDFVTSDSAVLLHDEARHFFLQRYQDRLRVQVRYTKWEQNLTYRQCLVYQVEHMARCILERDVRYQPLVLL